jgi:hypothetical protein
MTTDQKTETRESTRRYRMLTAALKNLEKAPDATYHVYLEEFDVIRRLYVAARSREVEDRSPKAFLIPAGVMNQGPMAKMEEQIGKVQRVPQNTITDGIRPSVPYGADPSE